MTIPEALDHMAFSGSEEDPIWYAGEETTPGDLCARIDQRRSADSVRITYFVGMRKIRGTLAGMARARGGR